MIEIERSRVVAERIGLTDMSDAEVVRLATVMDDMRTSAARMPRWLPRDCLPAVTFRVPLPPPEEDPS